jgi:hypothetical protein
MNGKQIRGRTVINIADGTQVGTVDQVTARHDMRALPRT